MIATEAHATENWWCPWAVRDGPAPSGPFVNRGTRCLASGCSQWRWYEDAFDTHRSRLTYRANPAGGWIEEPPDEPPGEGWEVYEYDDEGVRIWRRINPARRGYCGLSGKPEVPE